MGHKSHKTPAEAGTNPEGAERRLEGSRCCVSLVNLTASYRDASNRGVVVKSKTKPVNQRVIFLLTLFPFYDSYINKWLMK
jgi:hypothetical protein